MYLLTSPLEEDSDFIYGVFSTKELAIEYAKNLIENETDRENYISFVNDIKNSETIVETLRSYDFRLEEIKLNPIYKGE
jgi:uncharacterized protein with ACT and thioredoxin-like domain